jgi:hypothetical protein
MEVFPSNSVSLVGSSSSSHDEERSVVKISDLKYEGFTTEEFNKLVQFSSETMVQIKFPNGIIVHLVPNFSVECALRVFSLIQLFKIDLLDQETVCSDELNNNLYRGYVHRNYAPIAPSPPGYGYEPRDINGEARLVTLIGLMYYKDKISKIVSSSQNIFLSPLNWNHTPSSRTHVTISTQKVDLEKLGTYELPCLGYTKRDEKFLIHRISSESFVRESISLVHHTF